MNKKVLAAEILNYWYLLEFMNQEDFPCQKKAEKDECNRAKRGESQRKQITVFETLKADALLCEGGSNHTAPTSIPGTIMQQGRTYRKHPVVSDEIELCI